MMNVRPVGMEEVKSVLERVGVEGNEASVCMAWSHSKLDEPLGDEDQVLAELTDEEQAFLRCMGYVFEEKEIDPLRLVALHKTFWTMIRGVHHLPSEEDITVKEGRYIVQGG
jgi:hypothetical protein